MARKPKADVEEVVEQETVAQDPNEAPDLIARRKLRESKGK